MDALKTEPLLTTVQAAQRLAISEETLTTWRCRKPREIAFVKVGAAVRYRPADIDAYVERRLQAA